MIRFLKRKKAAQLRCEAIAKLKDAEKRRDTRDIHRLQIEARKATNECLRLGV